MSDKNFIPDYVLLAYLDGQAEPAMAQTIEADLAALRPRLDALQAQQAALTAQFGRIRPDSLSVGEHEMGLARRDANALKRHPHAAKSAELLNQFWNDVAPAESETPGLLQQVQTLIAQLVGSDVSADLAFGLRGAQEGVYEAGGYQIVIEADADFDDQSRQMLAGMVTGRDDWEGFSAELYRANLPHPVASSDIDTFGNFSFSRLESGSYELIIAGQPFSDDESHRVEIHIQTLKL